MGQMRSPNVTDEDLSEIREYLARTPILFGSSVRGTADRSSDIDIAVGFPDQMDRHERFRLRNRIDADLQQYADSFVDVSDIDSLPTPVAYAALHEGHVLTGDERVIETARRRLERDYEATAGASGSAACAFPSARYFLARCRKRSISPEGVQFP